MQTRLCKSFIDLQAQRMQPMHWGTFHFGIDHFSTPLEQLRAAWQQRELADDRLVIAKVGESICAPFHTQVSSQLNRPQVDELF